ncbi:MAG: DUF4430 domain-containing protein [Candidatus Lokiarchaeota archaeon]|nr:DUF4430 domain-containing protein [Candidatus Lokiarchaeota archaeon]
MKNPKKALSIIGLLLLIQILYQSSIPIAKADSSIPVSYSQDLDINGTYVYNITQFNTEVGWYNFAGGFEGNWKTNAGGQIKLNLTGFYDKDPYDWGNLFEDPIPWLDIEILEYNLGILSTNFTLNNRSNSEISRALTLGYNVFQPGFLIPNDNLTYIKNSALGQADPGGLYDLAGEVNVEETHNFLYIGFDQIGGNQKTYMIYDKGTGLLVWAKTSVFGYLLEIRSLNFTMDDRFIYNVIQFSGATSWYNLTFGLEGDWRTSAGGQIKLNLTGFYDKDPNDWGNVIDDPIPWFDIEILDNSSGILSTNFTLSNKSSSELSWSLILGHNNFQPGFLIPIIDNLTKVKNLALEEASGFVSGLVSFEETHLTIRISFDQIGGGQRTYMIYEKHTGLLLWANSSVSGYLLEMTLENYIPWEPSGEDIPPPDNLFLKFLPYIIITSLSIILVSASLLVAKLKSNYRKFNKYALIAILATASFASFFVFTTSIEIADVNKPLREVHNLTLIVDYGNGTVKTIENFELTDYNTTAFDALINGCQIEYKDYGEMGILVEEIDGVKGNWRYSVNSDFPGVSSDKYNLKNGDIVKWVFS